MLRHKANAVIVYEWKGPAAAFHSFFGGELIVTHGLVLCKVYFYPQWMVLSTASIKSTVQVSNLLLAAGPTHSWYKRKFDEYPAARKAVIPFLY
jgi:hypothetical protein